MRKGLSSVVALAIVAFGLATASAQTQPAIVEMRITLPDGKGSLQMRMSERRDAGEGWGGFGIEDVAEFGVRVQVKDYSTGVVRITIYDGYKPDAQVLEEVEAVAGGSPVQSATSPSLGIAVLRIIRR